MTRRYLPQKPLFFPCPACQYWHRRIIWAPLYWAHLRWDFGATGPQDVARPLGAPLNFILPVVIVHECSLVDFQYLVHHLGFGRELTSWGFTNHLDSYVSSWWVMEKVSTFSLSSGGTYLKALLAQYRGELTLRAWVADEDSATVICP